MNTQFKVVGLLVVLGSLVACAAPQQHSSASQPVYSNSNNGYNAPVNNGYNNNANQTWGTVTRVDNLGSRKDSGTGALIGAAVGAIAGNQIGRTMNDAKTTGTVVGAVGGGLLGNAIERNQNKNNTVLRVYVRLDNGSERSWDVTEAQITPSVGQRVRIENDQLFTN